MQKSKFSRKKNPRKALLTVLATQVILYEKVRTTHAKARNVSVFLNKVLNKLKGKNKLIQIRILSRYLRDELASRKVIDTMASSIESNKCFTSVYKISKKRPGDASDMSLIVLNK